MFDIGFSELFIILVVGLLVIGPERLPKVARTLGALFGRLQRYVNDVKADISREVELEELRKMKSEFEDAARSVEKSVQDELRSTQEELRGAEEELNRSIASPDSLKDGGSAPAAASAQTGTSESPEAPEKAAAASGQAGTSESPEAPEKAAADAQAKA